MDFKKIIFKTLISAAIISLPFTVKADIYKDNNVPDEIKTKIEKIVDAPSHLDGMDNFKRKPRAKRVKDNIDWYKKYGKVNNLYNKYCLDIENFGNQDDFIDFRTGFKHQEKCDRSKRKFSMDNKLSLYSEVQKNTRSLSLQYTSNLKAKNY